MKRDVKIHKLKIVVTQGANPTFVADTVCFGDSTTLDATINGLGLDNDSWQWDCDIDGVINSDDSLFKFKFTYPGIHFVELTVENDYGGITCTATEVKQILVWDLPNPSIREDTTCFGDTSRIINISSGTNTIRQSNRTIYLGLWRSFNRS